MITRKKNNWLEIVEFQPKDLSADAFAYYSGLSVEITRATTGIDKGEFFMNGEPLGGDIESIDYAFSALYADRVSEIWD